MNQIRNEITEILDTAETVREKIHPEINSQILATILTIEHKNLNNRAQAKREVEDYIETHLNKQ